MKTKLIALAVSTLIISSAAFADPAGPQGAGDGKREHRAHKMHERMKAADKNNDGQISREEANASLPHVAKHFDDFDTNKDGQISKEEFKAHHEKRVAARGGAGK